MANTVTLSRSAYTLEITGYAPNGTVVDSGNLDEGTYFAMAATATVEAERHRANGAEIVTDGDKTSIYFDGLLHAEFAICRK